LACKRPVHVDPEYEDKEAQNQTRDGFRRGCKVTKAYLVVTGTEVNEGHSYGYCLERIKIKDFLWRNRDKSLAGKKANCFFNAYPAHKQNKRENPAKNR
jgi:hypothetical protein